MTCSKWGTWPRNPKHTYIRLLYFHHTSLTSGPAHSALLSLLLRTSSFLSPYKPFPSLLFPPFNHCSLSLQAYNNFIHHLPFLHNKRKKKRKFWYPFCCCGSLIWYKMMYEQQQRFQQPLSLKVDVRKKTERSKGTEEERLEIVDLSAMSLDSLPNPSLNLATICKLDLSNNNLQVLHIILHAYIFLHTSFSDLNGFLFISSF